MLATSKLALRRLPKHRFYSSFDESSPSKLPANTIIKFVPTQEAWLVERMGKFQRVLEPGLAILVPFIDQIAYVQTLKEVATSIPSQSAITLDNVTLNIDGVLYYRIFDAVKASYGIQDAQYAISQLAQTTMRSEIGQLTLDRTLAERAALNIRIVEAMNSAATEWGVKVLRYEIKDIHPPRNVVDSMHQQVSAERTKRAKILESEGIRQAAINVAEGNRQSQILESEADKEAKINMAKGDSEGITLRAEATASALKQVSEALQAKGAQDAIQLRVAEQYIDAFSQLAKETNTVIVPQNVGDAAGMVTQLMSVFKGVQQNKTVS